MATLAQRLEAKTDRTGAHHIWMGAKDDRGTVDGSRHRTRPAGAARSDPKTRWYADSTSSSRPRALGRSRRLVVWRHRGGADGRPRLITSGHGGHPEEDLAMLALFGPVPDPLLDAYNQINALDHDWRQRVELFQVYPLLADSGVYLAPGWRRPGWSSHHTGMISSPIWDRASSALPRPPPTGTTR